MFDFVRSTVGSLLHIPQQLLLLLIRLYQRTLSPDHGWLKGLFPGGFCRYTPSCSEYSHQAILRYGFIRGGMKSVGRILRCNPCSRGGIDLVK